MIFIGTDIVQISRIEKLINDKGEKFLHHLYTEKEHEHCISKAEPNQHFAGKFAAKEAVKKAVLSYNPLNHLTLRKIEVLNNKSGAPSVTIRKNKNELNQINISISHAGNYAIATAVIVLK